MSSLHASPRLVTDPSSCLWYHSMTLPTVGEVVGCWDLRPTSDAYLSDYDFTGKRCLDVGTASGFLTFEMERRGAHDVVSLDLDSSERMDVVPFPDVDLSPLYRQAAINYDGIQNGYWLAHRLLGSRARVHYGSAYAIPDELGRFDVAMVGMMLPHCRDPLAVLAQVGRLADTIIVTQQAPGMPDAYAYFMPDAANPLAYPVWWSMSDACLAKMLGVVGYRVLSQTKAEHACPERGDGAVEACTTTVAVRR